MIPPAAPGILGAESLPMTGPRLCPCGRATVRKRRPAGRRRPGPSRAAPEAPTLLGFGREMPGFHPRAVRGFSSLAPKKKPHSPGN